MSNLPLKRLVSILLLSVFLFNVGGYYLLFIGLHHRSDTLLSKKIEAEQFQKDELIELKVPITLPYPLQENNFQKADGRFEHEGTFYKLVKQKFDNDTLYIVCIRDVATKQLTSTLKDYVAKTNDLPVNSKNTLNLFGKFLKDFQKTDEDFTQSQNGWELQIVFANPTFTLRSASHHQESPPPEA